MTRTFSSTAITGENVNLHSNCAQILKVDNVNDKESKTTTRRDLKITVKKHTQKQLT
jgi:hypothetical protein